MVVSVLILVASFFFCFVDRHSIMTVIPQRNPIGSGMRYAPAASIHGVLGHCSSAAAFFVSEVDTVDKL